MAGTWAEIMKTHVVDEETIRATEVFNGQGIKSFADSPSLQYYRDQIYEAVKNSEPPVTEGVTMKEMTIPGPDQQPPVTVFVHTPCQLPPKPPIVLYFHGGGLICSFAKTTSEVADKMAKKSGAIVINVDYRLLPNEKDPMCPFNDAKAVARWVLQNRAAIGGSWDSPVGTAGDSSGGQLACIVSAEVPGMAFQILVYPVVDVNCAVPSMKTLHSMPIFGGRDMEKMFEVLLPLVEDPATNPKFNPMANPNMATLPSTLIINAELDPIRDWALAYEEKLKKAGVKVKSSVYEGVPHLFYTLPLLFPKASERAYCEVADFIKSFSV